MIDDRPGLNPRRLLTLMQRACERCSLDLSGAIVLTEAATGSYAVTPILAAMAGARVYARTRSTRYGSFEQVSAITSELAELAGVADRVRLSADIPEEAVREADIVTNSGHIRPLDGSLIARMKSTVVIPLMYEAWEFRSGDVDLEACLRKGIPVGGTNERHPAVDVFSFLGIMAVRLLLDAGIEAYGSHVLLLCDNDFGPFIEAGLRGAGANLWTAVRLQDAPRLPYDAVVVALKSGSRLVLSADDAASIAGWDARPVVLQYWGDIEREAFEKLSIPLWPREAPPWGHMGVLPSAVGPDPIVRLQSGSLKVGEILWRERAAGKSCEESLAALAGSGFGAPVIYRAPVQSEVCA